MSEFFDQAEQNIKSLVAEGNFNKAYKLCKSLIKKFPQANRVVVLKKNIEEAVYKKNNKLIKEKIKKLDPLWKEKALPELIKQYRELLKLNPTHSKLKSLLNKAQNEYKDEIEKIEKDFNETQMKKLNNLFEKDTNLLLDELFRLEKTNRGNKNVLLLTKQFKEKVISKKIKEKEDLIYSEKFDAIKNLISQLQKIDNKNPEIEELIKMTKGRQYGLQRDEKTDFIYNASTHLNTLMRLKKYKEAIQVANEIIEINPKNKKTKKILKKAENKYFNKTREKTITSIIDHSKTLKESFSKNKEKYIKI